MEHKTSGGRREEEGRANNGEKKDEGEGTVELPLPYPSDEEGRAGEGSWEVVEREQGKVG
jgi:hypothetical protein